MSFAKWVSIRWGTAGLSIKRKPVVPIRQPIASALSGYTALREARTLMPPRCGDSLPTITTAAAPSPNKPVPTMLAMEGSSH